MAEICCAPFLLAENMFKPVKWFMQILVLIGAAASAANDSQSPTPGEKAVEGFAAVAELHVVDCLLPGQVRQVGRRTYLTPRRPVRTTAGDCSLRGGEFVAYDRADYKSALNVWMPAAQAGDAEAQTNVGEIFERGLGDAPNYEAAIIWYEKAAAQGNARAQFNLGTLYEQGLGVPQDNVAALNWYRRAWGIEEDDVIFASAAEREREALRMQLEQSVREKDAQVELLDKRLRELQEKLNLSTQESQEAQSESQTLKSLIAQLEAQRQESRARLNALPKQKAVEAEQKTGPKTREPVLAGRQDDDPEDLSSAAGTRRSYRNLELGAYYALLIGNANYGELDDLNTPLSDVARAKEILENRYGFTVFTITDGDNIEVMRAINDLYEVVGEEDNLLLFYAGHGNRLTTGGSEIGYWLPSNAEAPPRNTFWVANEFVTGHLSRVKAKRVLVVADSCYAGLLSTEPSFLLVGDDGPQYSNLDFLRFKLGKRSRLLMSSGGDRPVLDGGGGSHSVFARAFLDELENNSDLLPGPELYLRIRDRVELAAAQIDFDQQPEFKTIKSAGHEVGDFFFVPSSLR